MYSGGVRIHKTQALGHVLTQSVKSTGLHGRYHASAELHPYCNSAASQVLAVPWVFVTKAGAHQRNRQGHIQNVVPQDTLGAELDAPAKSLL